MTYRFVWAGVAILASALPAQDVESRPPAAESRPLSAKERVAAIDKEAAAAREAFFKVYREAKTDAEKQKAFEEKYPKPENWFGRLFEIANGDPKGEGAEAALLWIVTRGQGGKTPGEALDILMRDHITSKNVADAADALAYSTTPKAEEFLKALEAKNPNRDVKGRAVYAQADQKKNLARTVDYVRTAAGEELEHVTKEYDAAELARLRAIDTAGIDKEVEALLERVQAEFKDVEASYGGTLGERAAGDLFEIRHLAVGKVAPEIEGEDVFGKALKLSDHRGKVVVIDFWGHW
jgi:hypothetical protein